MDSITLTKKLVSIPSYLGKNSDEQKVGEFIFGYLKQFKWLRVIKEPVKNGRFNVIATDGYPTKLLFCGHMDTVEPKGKSAKPFIKGENLYGLGSSDMKSTLACMLLAIEKLGPTKGLMWLFYIDEEYDFLGMNQFIKDYKNKIKPEIIVGEGTDNEIRNGCRGLIEIKFTILGKTGHASCPENGNNAILGAQKIFEKLASAVAGYTDPLIGNSSINLASIDGGLGLSEGQIGRQGNRIADYCEFIIDVRTATNKLRAADLIKIAETEALKNNLGISCVVRHDKLGWFSPVSAIPKNITDKYKQLKDPKIGGYVDTQMLNEAFGCPCFGFGAGLSSQAHKENEYVPVKNMKTCEQFYLDLSQILKGGEIL